MRGLSEQNLNKLWREACLTKHNSRCFMCGRHITQTTLEVHHYIKRKNWLTRYDWRNGFPVCKYPTQWHMSCHQFAETPQGRNRIVNYLLFYQRETYLQDRVMPLKQYLVEHGMTKNDYLKQIYDELKGIINA